MFTLPECVHSVDDDTSRGQREGRGACTVKNSTLDCPLLFVLTVHVLLPTGHGLDVENRSRHYLFVAPPPLGRSTYPHSFHNEGRISILPRFSKEAVCVRLTDGLVTTTVTC